MGKGEGSKKNERKNLLVVEFDVWNPDFVCGYSHTGDVPVFFRVPSNVIIVPALCMKHQKTPICFAFPELCSRHRGVTIAHSGKNEREH